MTSPRSTRPLLRVRTVGTTLALTALIVAGCGGGGSGRAETARPEPVAEAVAAEDTTAPALPATAEDTDEATTGGPALRALPPADGVPVAEQAGPRPVGLSIADLDIESSTVRPVGVEPNGEFEVPIASEVGWYRFGSGPGEEGSAVLAAHIAFDGEDGVFRHLDVVELGALVDIDLEDGTTLTYEIVDLETYDKTALPFDDIFDESGPDRLVLITCGGEFNPDLRSYESNVVAYARLVG